MSATFRKSSNDISSKDIPVTSTDIAIFDDDFVTMKERFINEMQKFDQEITKLSTTLTNLNKSTPHDTVSVMSVNHEPENQWDVVKKSPLVEGEGENQNLKLQFDLSQFEPTEVKVSILNDILLVQAAHAEKSQNRTIVKEFVREVQLPKELDPNTIISFLSRDGILIVQAPLPPVNIIEDNSSMASHTTN